MPPNQTRRCKKEAKKRAEDAAKQAKQAKTYREFGLLAEKLSDDDFHVNMGDHKPQDASALPPPIVKAAGKMKPGDVSDLIQLDNALHDLPAGSAYASRHHAICGSQSQTAGGHAEGKDAAAPLRARPEAAQERYDRDRCRTDEMYPQMEIDC